MENEKEYFAFISYKREDEKWAKWLQHKLEHYKLPSNLNGRTDLPKEIRPIFRDQSELAAGVLADEINKALTNSKYLIVICSPRAAQSVWVGKEVQTFIDLGRTDKIIPFIIGGTAHAQNPEEECFPLALLNLPPERELLGINIDEMGRDAAAVKVVARMFGLKFDTLWQRRERERRRRRIWIVVSIITAFLAVSGIATWMYIQRQKTLEANWKMMENQARFVATNAENLIYKGENDLACRIAMETLPVNLKKENVPYTVEAEKLLRTARRNQYQIIAPVQHRVDDSYPCQALFSPDNSSVVYSVDDYIFVWDIYKGIITDTLDMDAHKGYNSIELAFSSDGKWLKGTDSYNNMKIWNMETKSIVYDDLDSSVVFDRKIQQISIDSVYNFVNAYNNCFYLENRKTGELYGDEFIGHTDNITCWAFSMDGKYLVTGSNDCTIRVWNIGTKNCEKIIAGHSQGISSIDVSPDNKFIVSTSADNSVRLWPLMIENDVIENDGWIRDMGITQDDIYYAHTDNNKDLQIYDVCSKKIINKIINSTYYGFTDVSFSPDLKSIVITSCDKSHKNRRNEGVYFTYILDTKTGDTLTKCVFPYKVCRSWFTHDSKNIVFDTYDENVVIWNCDDNTYECLLDYSKIKFSPNEKRQPWNSFMFCTSCNNSYVAISDNINNVAYIYGLNGILQTKLIGHSEMINSITYSNDDKYIVTSSQDCSIKIWNSKTGECLRTIRGHDDYVLGAVFDPSGEYVLSYSTDNTIRLWKARDGDCVEILQDPESVEKKYYKGDVLGFTPNGRQFISSDDYNGIIRIWDFPPLQELIDQTRERFKDRPLTPEERHQYYLE